MSSILENVKVIELGAWVAGPGAGAVLGDWGAEVIKIEDPITGDPVRGWKSIRGIKVTDVHFWFELYNRNKKSLGLDLRSEFGREIFYKLVKKSDVFLTNFQYSVLKKLRIDYETLSNLNPKLVYAVISGYGRKGRDTEKPGYDITAFWSRSGILNKMISKGKPPIMPPHAMGDTSVGTIMAGAISAALFNRERSGTGQEVEISLLQTAVWTSAMDVEAALYTGTPIPQLDRTMVMPLENDYQTKDGKWLHVAMIQSDRFWPSFCKALGIEHLEKDERFNNAENRDKHNPELISILDNIFITKNCTDWDAIFDKNGLICAPIQSFSDIVNDPQAIENDFFVEVDHPTSKKVKVIATPVNFGKTPATIRSSAPEVGQHTEEILLELGYSWDAIAAYKEKKVIN